MNCNNCYVPSNILISNVYIREVIKEEIISVSDTLKGESAYEVAVKLGYEGNEEEWLSEQGATIEQINVNTGEAGTEASVVLNGTPKNRIIDLTIPKGDKGIQGEKGDTGEKGDKGIAGRDGSYVQKAYKTYAGMIADKDSIPIDTSVVVNNDPDKSNNAFYTYDGTEFTKSDFDPQGILTTVDVRLNQAVESASDYFQSQVADTIDTAIDNSTVAYTEAINTTKAQVVADAKAATESALDTAVTNLFENGGLPATPFTTKALMTASALVDDDYAYVTDDSVTANNGLYVKTAGAWVKSDYDPLAILKKYTEEVFRTNNNSQTLRFSDFNNVGGFSADGRFSNTALSGWRHTEHIRVVAGDVINATYFVSVSGFAPILFFDNTKEFKSNLVVSTGGDSYKTTTATAPSDGYVVFQHNLLDFNVTTKDTEAMKFELISTGVRYLDYDTISEAVSNTPAIKQKADLVKTSEYKDWSQGYVDGAGNETIDNNFLRTIVYKFPAGTQVTIKKPTGYGPQFGYSTSSTPKVLHSDGQWFGENNITFTVTKEKPYVRFFLRNFGADGDLSKADVITITSESKVVYADDLADLASTSNSVGLPPFESNFRDPSRATGGVMTIIDDDGGSLLYSSLYPFLKSNEVPFGAAIMGGTVGKSTHEGRASVTLSQLKELCEDVIGFELMSHSWTHGNQVNLPTAEKILQVERNKQWFIENGFNNVSGFVYPYGADDIESRNRVMKYYNAAYDYADGVILTPDNINNHLIKRYSFDGKVEHLQNIKNAIDGAVAVNGWIVVTVHVGHPSYWFADSYDLMQEIIDYAKSKGIQFMLPKDGFQTYGNFMESSNGFRIQSNGKIVGAT